jgi:hypothetical protein
MLHGFGVGLVALLRPARHGWPLRVVLCFRIWLTT